ncbi:MAG: hypothetical protein WDN31_04880 [Hyphomicrobium sp.]
MNIDKLTYAGNLENLASIADAPNYRFVQGDIAMGRWSIVWWRKCSPT